jgi:hypothetical protein
MVPRPAIELLTEWLPPIRRIAILAGRSILGNTLDHGSKGWLQVTIGRGFDVEKLLPWGLAATSQGYAGDVALARLEENLRQRQVGSCAGRVPAT